jgi:hypothetical protein
MYNYSDHRFSAVCHTLPLPFEATTAFILKQEYLLGRGWPGCFELSARGDSISPAVATANWPWPVVMACPVSDAKQHSDTRLSCVQHHVCSSGYGAVIIIHSDRLCLRATYSGRAAYLFVTQSERCVGARCDRAQTLSGRCLADACACFGKGAGRCCWCR